MPKKVLVTGANGFTGSNLCRHLVARGDHVLALARPSAKLDALDGQNVEIVAGDLSRDDGIPAKALHNVEIVYHVAALYRQEGATRDVFYNVNVSGTERLLIAAKRAGVNRFVHCSTGGVHGHIERPPADEYSPFRPGDWYQETKLEGEKLALAFGRKHHLPVSVIRPSPIYGAGDMRFFKLFKAINNGTFLMIGDGKPLYHFVYVDDLVQAFLLAGEREEAVGEQFIISGPQYVPIQELVDLIAQELGRPPIRRHVPVWPVMLAAKACKRACTWIGIEPPLYPRRLDFFIKDRAFDSGKAKALLDYNPQVDLETGISLTAAWYIEHGLLTRRGHATKREAIY
jgi:nucleoside-diphosphate-sugar epimerase